MCRAICKCRIGLYKGLEHLGFGCFSGDLGTNSTWVSGLGSDAEVWMGQSVLPGQRSMTFEPTLGPGVCQVNKS